MNADELIEHLQNVEETSAVKVDVPGLGVREIKAANVTENDDGNSELIIVIN